MSYTNSTAYYNLPQWISSDKPNYLNDFNGAFLAIDTAIHNAADTASQAYSKAESVEGSVTTIVDTTIPGIQNDIGDISIDISTNIRPTLEATEAIAQDALAFPDQGAGEEFTVWSAFGFITSGATEINLFVPTPKVFAEGGNGISVETLMVMLKGADGNLYTGSTYFDFIADPDTQVDAQMAGDCQIRIKLTNTSGFSTGSVNNRPVIAYGTLKFHVL